MTSAADPFARSARRLTAWQVFVLLLALALAGEYWNKNALGIGGVQVPWPLFMPALLVLPLLLPRADRRWSKLTSLPRPLEPMIVFWACCGFSLAGVIVAPDSLISQYLKTFVHLTLYVAFVFVVARWMTFDRLRLLVHAYYAVGIAAAILACVQMLHGSFGLLPTFTFLRLQSAEHDVGLGLTTGFRASSFFGEPSWAARYYVHFMAVALAYWFNTQRRRHLAALVLFVVAFYGANSLLGYVILTAFLGGLGAVYGRRMLRGGRVFLALGAAAAYALLVLWLLGAAPRAPDLIERSLARLPLVIQGGGGAGNRIDSVFAGLEVWQLSPVFGVGLGNIDRYIYRYYQDPAWVLRSQYASDSLYVQILAEAGIAGLLGFLWFWGRLLFFRSPAPEVLEHDPSLARAYTCLRLLQIDLFAQAVGMLNASDYLNPHLWTVVVLVLGLKIVIIRRLRLGPEPLLVRSVGARVPGFAV